MTNNYERKTQQIFAENVSQASNQMTVVGSTASGNTQYSTDIKTIQNNPAWKNGLYSSVVAGKSPLITDDNAIYKVITQQLAYILQKGIAEFDNDTTYFKGNICCIINAGIPTLFYSLTDNNLNNNPITSQTNWFNLNQLNFTSLTIVNSINFNEFNKNGNFTIANNIHINAPITTSFVCNLQVFNDGTTNNLVQLLQDITNGNSYIRYCINGIWNEWINTSVNDKADKDLSNINLTPIIHSQFSLTKGLVQTMPCNGYLQCLVDSIFVNKDTFLVITTENNIELMHLNFRTNTGKGMIYSPLLKQGQLFKVFDVLEPTGIILKNIIKAWY